MELQSKRLKIIPLSLENFRVLLEDYPQLEKNLGVKLSNKVLDKEIKNIFRKPYQDALQDSENYLWYTNWQCIDYRLNQIVCSLCFKGVPDLEGIVEIGYGTEPIFKSQGYMTEALGAVLKWALKQKKVNKIIAETDKPNIASQRVLEKNGFKKSQVIGDSIWWEISKSRLKIKIDEE